MAALAIASILAAAALPTMSGRVKDQRSQSLAQQFALLYREGRTRAIGRGTAHLVRFDTSTNPAGIATMLEAIQPVGNAGNLGQCQNLPRVGVDGCAVTAWGAADSRLISTAMVQTKDDYTTLKSKFILNGTDTPSADICFSPGGRAYARPALNGAFSAFTGINKVRTWRVSSPANLLARDVMILPNGSTRVETIVLTDPLL